MIDLAAFRRRMPPIWEGFPFADPPTPGAFEHERRTGIGLLGWLNDSDAVDRREANAMRRRACARRAYVKAPRSYARSEMP